MLCHMFRKNAANGETGKNSKFVEPFTIPCNINLELKSVQVMHHVLFKFFGENVHKSCATPLQQVLIFSHKSKSK